MVPSPDFDPSKLPAELRAMLSQPSMPLVTDTWQCPKGHQVKVPQGAEPRMQFGPMVTPKAACLPCFLDWLAAQFPITKVEEPEEEKPSSPGLVIPG